MVLDVIHAPTAQDIVTAWTSAYRDRVGHEPTERAARQLAREARRLLAEGRPVDVVREAALLLVDDAAGPRLLESRVDRLLMGRGGRTAGPEAAAESGRRSDSHQRPARGGGGGMNSGQRRAPTSSPSSRLPRRTGLTTLSPAARPCGRSGASCSDRSDSTRSAPSWTPWRAPIRGFPRSRNSGASCRLGVSLRRRVG